MECPIAFSDEMKAKEAYWEVDSPSWLHAGSAVHGGWARDGSLRPTFWHQLAATCPHFPW